MPQNEKPKRPLIIIPKRTVIVKKNVESPPSSPPAHSSLLKTAGSSVNLDEVKSGVHKLTRAKTEIFQRYQTLKKNGEVAPLHFTEQIQKKYNLKRRTLQVIADFKELIAECRKFSIDTENLEKELKFVETTLLDKQSTLHSKKQELGTLKREFSKDKNPEVRKELFLIKKAILALEKEIYSNKAESIAGLMKIIKEQYKELEKTSPHYKKYQELYEHLATLFKLQVEYDLIREKIRDHSFEMRDYQQNQEEAGLAEMKAYLDNPDDHPLGRAVKLVGGYNKAADMYDEDTVKKPLTPSPLLEEQDFSVMADDRIKNEMNKRPLAEKVISPTTTTLSSPGFTTVSPATTFKSDSSSVTTTLESPPASPSITTTLEYPVSSPSSTMTINEAERVSPRVEVEAGLSTLPASPKEKESANNITKKEQFYRDALLERKNKLDSDIKSNKPGHRRHQLFSKSVDQVRIEELKLINAILSKKEGNLIAAVQEAKTALNFKHRSPTMEIIKSIERSFANNLEEPSAPSITQK